MIRTLLLVLLLVPEAAAQRFETYAAFRDTLVSATNLADAGERSARISALWDSLTAHGDIPFARGGQAAFLYRGSASQVRVAGDFNGWNPAASPAARLGQSDVWLREEAFPTDARLDYKFVIGSSTWILDPANPHRQRGGFGDNSEIRMPDYVPSPYVTRRAGVPRGDYSSSRSVASSALGYTVNYRVYTPATYPAGDWDLPTIYVTDGHEYADDAVGSMRIVLDNLLHDGLIPPVMAVFVDPRVGSSNLRGDQYVENPDFAAFLADELVPEIEATYRARPGRQWRAILGTSLGGLNSAYVGAVRPDAFRMIGIQSPAFHAGNEIYGLYRDHPGRDLKIHMTWGTIRDVGTAGEQMATILSDRGYEFETVVLNEGHSWGSWRALLDDVLVYFFGGFGATGVDASVPSREPGLAVYPQPSQGQATVRYRLARPGSGVLRVVDLMGREVMGVPLPFRSTGEHEWPLETTALPAGVYVITLDPGDGSSRSTLHVVR